MSYKVKELAPDSKLNARVMELELSGKKIVTPSKTIDNSKATVSEVNEISITLSPKTIASTIEDGDTVLRKLHRKIIEDMRILNVVIPEYPAIGFEKRHLETIDDYLHPLSDVIVVPKWSGILSAKKDSMLDDLKIHSKKYIDEANIRNGKLIMGNIPMTVSDKIVNGLVDFYLSEGIHSFVLDFNNGLLTKNSNVVRSIQKKLDSEKLSESSLLYSTNIRGRTLVDDYYTANDFIAFGYGVDLMGNYHMRGRENKDKPIKNWTFNPEEYTYEEVPMLVPKSSINKIENEEAKKISQEIIETGTAYDVVKDKKGAKEIIDLKNA